MNNQINRKIRYRLIDKLCDLIIEGVGSIDYGEEGEVILHDKTVDWGRESF